MESYLGRAAEGTDEKEPLYILRDGVNYYAKRLQDLWNEAPNGDESLLLFSMENMAPMIRKTWPEIGAMADVLGGMFSSTIIAASVPRKENET